MADLKQLSLYELINALDYVENMAAATNQASNGVWGKIKEKVLTETEMETDIVALVSIFEEHDKLSFDIEKELDRRWKKRLGIKNTTTTLKKRLKSIDDKIRNRVQEKEKTNLTLS